jgi:hypothetical protein
MPSWAVVTVTSEPLLQYDLKKTGKKPAMTTVANALFPASYSAHDHTDFFCEVIKSQKIYNISLKLYLLSMHPASPDMGMRLPASTPIREEKTIFTVTSMVLSFSRSRKSFSGRCSKDCPLKFFGQQSRHCVSSLVMRSGRP